MYSYNPAYVSVSSWYYICFVPPTHNHLSESSTPLWNRHRQGRVYLGKSSPWRVRMTSPRRRTHRECSLRHARTGPNICTIAVPTPGFALVFFSDEAYEDPTPSGNTITFATAARTRTINTATIDPEALATSNGHSGKDRADMTSTSKGRVNAGRDA